MAAIDLHLYPAAEQDRSAVRVASYGRAPNVTGHPSGVRSNDIEVRAKRADLNLERRRATRLLPIARRAPSIDEGYELARRIQTLDRGEVPFLEARTDPVEREGREAPRSRDVSVRMRA